MLNQMKRIAVQAAEAGDPARFLFGEVTGTNPLKIMVDSRFEIEGDMIVLTREFQGGAYSTHTHTVNPHSHTVPSHTTEAAQLHSHGVPALNTGETPLVTEPEVYAGLQAGDRVVLLRNQGGQQYLVLGRV